MSIGGSNETIAFIVGFTVSETSLLEFQQAVRAVNPYTDIWASSPCMFANALWNKYLRNHQHEHDLFHLWEKQPQQPFSDSLVLLLEKTRCMLLEWDILQRPTGGTIQSPRPLLHTMLHWGVPNYLIYLAARIYPQELQMRDFDGKLPLDIVTQRWTASLHRKDPEWSQDSLLSLYDDTLAASPITTTAGTTTDNHHGGRQPQPPLLELIKRQTPIALLSHLTTRTAPSSPSPKATKRKRSVEEEVEEARYSSSRLQSFLDCMARNKGDAWEWYRGSADPVDLINLTMIKEMLEDLEYLIKLAPSALERVTTTTTHQHVEKEEEEVMLPACMIPATKDDRPYLGHPPICDVAHDVLVLNLIYFTLRQHPLVLFSSSI